MPQGCVVLQAAYLAIKLLNTIAACARAAPTIPRANTARLSRGVAVSNPKRRLKSRQTL